MRAWLERRPGVVLVAGAVVMVLVVLVFSGGRVRPILSTVGAAVGDATSVSGNGVGTGGTATGTGTGSASGDDGPAPRATTGPGAAAADAALAPASGLLIVHTGSLRIRVAAIPAALDGVTATVVAAGGYVATSKTSGSDADATASIEVRVPAGAWDRTLTALRGIGTVLDQEIGSEEVTGQVIDLEARVENLRATEAALQAIMAKATRIQDILDVQQQLTEARGEIEQLTAKADGLRDRAAYGSLSIQLSVPAPARTPTPVASRPPIWDPGRDAMLASEKLVRIGQLGTTAAIWLAIVGLPSVVSIAIGLGILRVAWLAARRIGRRAARQPT